jgi:hypothetical protein
MSPSGPIHFSDLSCPRAQQGLGDLSTLLPPATLAPGNLFGGRCVEVFMLKRSCAFDT